MCPDDIRHGRRSPGADPEIYFASDQHERRLTSLHGEINDMIYGSHEAPNAKCTLSVRGCPARLPLLHFIHAPCLLASAGGRIHRVLNGALHGVARNEEAVPLLRETAVTGNTSWRQRGEMRLHSTRTPCSVL